MHINIKILAFVVLAAIVSSSCKKSANSTPNVANSLKTDSMYIDSVVGIYVGPYYGPFNTIYHDTFIVTKISNDSFDCVLQYSIVIGSTSTANSYYPGIVFSYNNSNSFLLIIS